MISKEPLIVVGMRFNPHYAKSKPTTHNKVCIIREPANKVNPKAVAVHFKEDSEYAHAGNRIGYIRDVDLHFLYNLPDNTTYPYKITRVCTNYLKLEPIATNETDYQNNTRNSSPFDEIFAKHHGSDYWFGDRYDSGIDYNTWATSIRGEWIANPSINADYLNKSKKDVQLTTKEEPKTMFNTINFKDSFFKEVKNVAMDMQSGKLGVVTKEGIVVATDDGVSVNPITEFGFKIPAFAMRVPIANLQKGDIIISGDDISFFVETNKVNGYLTINTKGVMQETGNVTNMFFGKNTVLAVKNMFGDSSDSMNPMVMAMALGDGEFDFKKMLMLQMFSGGKGGFGGDMNPMMMFALMGDKLK